GGETWPQTMVPAELKVLGPSQPQTTARYAHLDHDPGKVANEAIGRRVAAAIGGKPAAKGLKRPGQKRSRTKGLHIRVQLHANEDETSATWGLPALLRTWPDVSV